MNPNTFRKQFLPIAGFSLIALASSHAANIFQDANDGSSNAWSTDGGPWPGDLAPSAGNDYFTTAGLESAGTASGFNAPYTTRLRDNGSIFGGDSITAVNTTQITLKGNGTTTGNIILDGGMIVWAEAQQGAERNVAGNLTVTTTGGLLGLGSANIMNVASTLGGSGTLRLRSSDGTPTFTFSGALSGFTGTFDLGGGEGGFATLDFDQDYVLLAGIVMGTYSTVDVLNLDQAITVNSFQFDTANAAAGTYTVAELNAQYGLGTQFTGAGTLTVVPEPSTVLLGAFGSLFLLRRRRAV